MVAKVDMHAIHLKKEYMCSKTRVAKVDLHVIQLKKDYMCEKTMVAKVDLHVIQLKKDYMCAKTMVAKVDMIIESLLGYVPSKTMVWLRFPMPCCYIICHPV